MCFCTMWRPARTPRKFSKFSTLYPKRLPGFARGLQKYSDDPYHMEVVKKLLPMFSARAVCDFEFDPAKQKV